MPIDFDNLTNTQELYTVDLRDNKFKRYVIYIKQHILNIFKDNKYTPLYLNRYVNELYSNKHIYSNKFIENKEKTELLDFESELIG